MLLSIYICLYVHVGVYIFSYTFDWEVLLDQTVPAGSENENRSFQDFQSANKGHHDSVFFLPLKSE